MKKLFYLFIACLTPAGLLAQQVDITAQKIPQQAAFAAPFDVRFELSHTPGYHVQLDSQTIPENFTLTHQNQEVLSPGTVAYDLTFLPFSLGVSTFTALNFQLLDNQENVLAQTESEPVQITVSPVQLFKDKNMRDIRPPYVPTNWMLGLLCLLLIGAIVYLLRRFWKKKHLNNSLLQNPPDNRPADVIALSKIQFLLQSGLWEKQQYKLFYIELGDILREYFWRRFGLDVSADTSAELLRRARSIAELTPLLQALRSYLNSADLVKFAKVVPSQDTMHQDVRIVQTVVQKTTPSKPAVQEEK